MNVVCQTGPCKTTLSSQCVYYMGETLIYTGINTNDSVETALLKLNNFLEDNPTGGGGAVNLVTDYRSSYEVSDGKIYDGYNLNTTPTITRTLDGILENALGLSNLEADWINRLTLTYI